jgi:hypothetical protein
VTDAGGLKALFAPFGPVSVRRLLESGAQSSGRIMDGQVNAC